MKYNERILKYVMVDEHRIYYYKLKNGKVKFICSECNSQWYGTLKELKDIQRSHLCPKCYRKITTTNKDQYLIKFVFDEDNLIDDCYWGYAIHSTIKKARLSIKKIERMYKIYGSKHYIRNYHYCCMNGYKYKFTHDYNRYYKEISTNWRLTRAKQWRYYFDVYYNNDLEEREQSYPYQNYKEYLKRIPYKLNIKSNQMYIIQHNLMNYRQVEYMVLFDLKDIKQVSKYNKYIEKHDIYKTIDGLNVYDLDYISKNNINVGNYIDYIEICRAVGIKDKHPKDFTERDHQVNIIYQNMRDKEKNKLFDKKIKKIKLSNTSFKVKNKQYKIDYYHNANQILCDSKEFTNCMYSHYLEDYANRETDLYRCVDYKGKLIACIEIQDNEIQQIMGNKNSKPKLYKQIRTACLEMVGS